MSEYREKDKVVFEGKIHDFGYDSATPGKCVIYEEGECDLKPGWRLVKFTIFVMNNGETIRKDSEEFNYPHESDLPRPTEGDLEEALRSHLAGPFGGAPEALPYLVTVKEVG